MAHFPQSAAGLNYITYPAGPGAVGTTLTADGANNAKGTYVQFVASTPFAANALACAMTGSNTGGLRFLVDVATGPGGSETVLLPNLLVDGAGSGSHGDAFGPFPCDIPAGVRLAARCQCSTGASAVQWAMTLIAAGDTPGVSVWTNYGANTGDSGGVTVDPGGSINTKGGYVQITASTTAVTQMLVLMVSTGGNVGPNIARWALDVATGAGGAETVLIPDLRIMGLSTPHALIPNSYPLLTYIAAGTRLSINASCSINDATDRLIDVAILAGTAPDEGGSPSPGGEEGGTSRARVQRRM